MEIRNLGPLTAFVVAMVVIDAAISPVILTWAFLHQESLQANIGPFATELDYGIIAFHYLTMIVFSVWIYQAGANLVAAGFEDLEFTPGSRIWWFAIPIASLFKPFQGMRELWNASHGNSHYDDNNGLVTAWWTLWLSANLGYYFFNLAAGPETGLTALWVLSAVGIALAAVAIRMIHDIAQAQGRILSGDDLNEVFG